jgi:hypothetical protein
MYTAEHQNQYVLTMVVITSFQVTVQVGANVNIHRIRHWECSLDIHERDNDETNRQRV